MEKPFAVRNVEPPLRSGYGSRQRRRNGALCPRTGRTLHVDAASCQANGCTGSAPGRGSRAASRTGQVAPARRCTRRDVAQGASGGNRFSDERVAAVAGAAAAGIGPAKRMRSAGMVPHSTPLRGAVEVAPAREVIRASAARSRCFAPAKSCTVNLLKCRNRRLRPKLPTLPGWAAPNRHGNLGPWRQTSRRGQFPSNQSAL
jgi:hypothetical protein